MDGAFLLRGLGARAGIKPAPLSLTYEVTWLCNLACSYCDRHTRMRRELSREEIFSALEQFHRLGLMAVSLDGGDPLTHPAIDDIVAWLSDRNISISMHTNGILVPGKLGAVSKLSLVKISVDGPRERHDAMRGRGSLDKALAAARLAREAGVRVEFTCTVGRHNADCVDAVVDLAEAAGARVVFQPALESLFIGTRRDGSAWRLAADPTLRVFRAIEGLKRAGRAVGNSWSSLRHFRRFPQETRPPCAAGWVMATMDPEGVLFPCGQVDRSDRSNSVVRLGVERAFLNVDKGGCGQCWCARIVEANYAWGLRLDMMLPSRNASIEN